MDIIAAIISVFLCIIFGFCMASMICIGLLDYVPWEKDGDHK